VKVLISRTNASDLANLLRISPETVRRRARTGEYPSVPGLRVRRFPRDLVLQINLGAVASFYVAGAVVGALAFGWITDRYGRRLVFYVTLIVYLSAVLLSPFAWYCEP
jgi:MFS family permease